MSLGKNILLVDDHLVVRKGVELILREDFSDANIYSTEDYEEAIEVIKVAKIDLILLDININGIENIKIMNRIKALQKDVKILVFSSHEEKQYGLRYMQAGADGYLNKFCSESIIISAVKEIFNKGIYCSTELKEKLSSKSRNKSASTSIHGLSNREFEIAQLLINGYGNLEISNKLEIQTSTVSTYKNRIFEKLSINNIVALADLFKENNL
jgi:DNA-binding NarL/FixJ family response regulator